MCALFWIFPLAAIVICIWYAITDWCSFFEGLFITLIGVFISVLIGMGVISLVGSIALNCADYETYEHSRIELVALADNSSINGHFFLGSGNVDEERVYVYMYEDENGLTTDTVNADNCYIKIISNDTIPYMAKYRIRFDSGFWRFLLGDMGSHTTFFLPEGSIVSMYEVDLK